MVRNFRSNDEGKKVVDADGDEIGTIDRVSGNKAYVSPKARLSQSIRKRLGWEEEEAETYELMHSEVDSFSGDEIRLKD